MAVGDCERIGTGLVRADTARKQRARSEHAGRRFRVADRTCFRDGRRRNIHQRIDVVGRVRIGGGVHAGALVLADVERLCDNRGRGDGRFDPEHLERVAIGERLMVAAGGVVELVVVVIADVENIEAGSAGDLHRLKIRHAIQNVPDLSSALEYRCRRKRRPVHGECQPDEAAVVRRRNEDDGGIDLVSFGDVDREARGRDVVSGAVGDRWIVGIPCDRQAIDELHRQYFRTRKLWDARRSRRSSGRRRYRSWCPWYSRSCRPR